jgi:hypothetical protein
MRCSLAALGACAAAAAFLAVPVTAAHADPPPAAALTPIACHSTRDPARRSVSVVSIMRHRPGTRTLAVRVTLLEKRPGVPAVPVRDGDLGRWTTPDDPALGRLPADVWKLRKTVLNVDAPAVYRFRVTFRWRGGNGTVVSRRALSTARCGVQELRPDILVRSVAVRSAGLPAGDARYLARIANRGRTASGPFQVQFSPGGDGGPPQTVEVGSLAAHGHTSVRFLGRACDPAAPPTVIADPAQLVDDFDRSNNAVTVSCPASPAGAFVPRASAP